MTNCEVSLTLNWSPNCVITSMEQIILGQGQQQRENSPTGATFAITDCKLYVPFITLSAQDDNKLLERLKTGFKKTIK